MINQQIDNLEITNWAVGDAPLAGTDFAGPGLAAAIGNFDGVHLGHQAVIMAASTAAMRDNLMPAVITFDPHPREFFRQDDAPFTLTDRREKDRLLAGALNNAGGLSKARIIHITFDDTLRRTDAQSFVVDVLRQLGVVQLFAGADFAFGKGRGGDVDTIRAVGQPVGISASTVPLLADKNSAVISSSRIRAALQAGDPNAASAMLGRDWAVTGTVIKGDARGRQIGFPTANIALGNLQRPAFGVYAGDVYMDDAVDTIAGDAGLRLIGHAVANIGIRPTVENRGVLCEAHLFDRDLDLYDKRLLVCLKAFLRPEQKFSAIEDLINQIAVDAEAARQLLSKLASGQS